MQEYLPLSYWHQILSVLIQNTDNSTFLHFVRVIMLSLPIKYDKSGIVSVFTLRLKFIQCQLYD